MIEVDAVTRRTVAGSVARFVEVEDTAVEEPEPEANPTGTSAASGRLLIPGERLPLALAPQTGAPTVAPVVIPRTLHGESFETPTGSVVLTLGEQRAQEIRHLSMISFLNLRQYYPSVHSWISWVREWGLLDSENPFGTHVWSALRSRISNSPNWQVNDIRESAESWFYPPTAWSKANALSSLHSGYPQSAYAFAYPCLAEPCYDSNGTVLYYKFVCVTIAVWGMRHPWLAHTTRICVTGTHRALPGGIGSEPPVVIDLTDC